MKLFDNDSLLGGDPEVGLALVSFRFPASLASLFLSFQVVLLASFLANHLAWLCGIGMFMPVFFPFLSFRPWSFQNTYFTPSTVFSFPYCTNFQGSSPGWTLGVVDFLGRFVFFIRSLWSAVARAVISASLSSSSVIQLPVEV